MFFPPMFGEEGENAQHAKDESTHHKYLELKKDYISLREKSKNTYDFYNIVEKSVLEMEGEESNRINES